jgi:hypothetical protein
MITNYEHQRGDAVRITMHAAKIVPMQKKSKFFPDFLYLSPLRSY